MKYLKPKYLVFIIPFLLYLNTCRNGYSFDDNFVVQNDRVKQGISAIPEIFTSYYHQEENNTFGYRPVVQSLFAVEYTLFGENPGINHLVSVLLYALLCLLIYRLLKNLFPNVKEQIILLIVVLFAVHPVHSEVVASLKNREEIVAMLLGLSSLFLFARYMDIGRFLYLIYLPFLIFLAVLSKENALTYPLLIPLVYLTKRGFLLPEITKVLIPVSVTILLFIVAWFAWKMPGMILPPAAKELFSFENPLHTDHSFSSRIYITGITLWFYLKILVIPYPLRFYYGFDMFPETGLNTIAAVVGFILYIFLLVLAFLKIRKHRELSFFIFFYMISLSVFSNYFIPVNGIVGERLVFQASLGFCGMLIMGINLLATNTKVLQQNLFRILYGLMIVFSVMTFQRNSDWKSVESILKADIGKMDKSAKGQLVYASWHMTKLMNQKAAGQYVQPSAIHNVIKHYKQSLTIYPALFSSYNSLGTLYLQLESRPDSALKYFKRAIELKPGYTEARYNAATCLLYLYQTDSAKKIILDLLKENENFANGWMRLADIYIAEKDFENAWPAAEKAAEYDTVSDSPYIVMGNILLMKNDTAGAAGFWEKAIARNPRNPKLLYGLSRYYQQTSKAEKAEKYRQLFEKYK